MTGEAPVVGIDVGIVADDLTGAADTAVQFTLARWPTRLLLDPDENPSEVDGAVAVSTDARARGEDARSITAHAVKALRRGGAQRLYLKVDSTMRGSVAAQVAGALDCWAPGSIALVCPAYPSMGRRVLDGVASANDAPLEDGPAGRDPVTPVATSRMSELLPGSVHLPATAYSTAAELLRAATSTSAAVVSVDAASDEDLDVIAAAVAAGGQGVVPVGSAGLARALAQCWRPGDAGEQPAATDQRRDGLLVVMVTSLHDVAAEQVAHLAAHPDLDAVHLTPSALDVLDPADGTDWGSRLDAAAQRSGDRSPVVVITAPPRDPDGIGAPEVAAALAGAVAYLHERARLRGVVAVGGDGVAALARRWSAASMTLHGAVTEGVPHGVLDGGEAHALAIVTKAGGFGAPDALVACVTQLLQITAPREDRP